MDLGAVMDEVGTRLGGIDGLRVYDYPADSVTPPAAIVAYPDEIVYDETYGRGMDRLTLPVLVVVGRQSDRASRDNLVGYASGSGDKSVKQKLEDDSYDSCDVVRVERAEFDIVRIAGVDYVAAMFDLDVTGQGD
ncbi:MAG: hypothetical protein ACODAF_07060 [Actinomycetota bacterium]